MTNGNDHTDRLEALGPAERILQTLTSFTDHMVHNRPGVVFEDPTSPIGVRWTQATWKDDGGERIVSTVEKRGKRQIRTRLGVVDPDGRRVKSDTEVTADGRVVARWRQPGLFEEVAAYLYRQAAEVWRMDNEFAARWASWSFFREHRDMKVILAALMLAQSRRGDPVVEDGEVLFHDDDYRDVGEAMVLLKKGGHGQLSPKMVLRVGEVLALPAVHEINRELGFSRSARNPVLKRYQKAVHRWLAHRERNPKMLDGLVSAGLRTTVIDLARKTRYKPLSEAFFDKLRWRQKQATTGHRSVAIGKEVSHVESWEGQSEEAICERIVADRPGFKRIVGMLPAEIGLTRAIMAAAVEAGSLSAADLVLYTPTLEELGLLEVPTIEQRWRAALEHAENQRAANIARNVASKKAREALQDATDGATARALEEATRDLRVYVCVDKSSSMQGALERAKTCLKQFVGGIPLDRLHVTVFNTVGTALEIKAPKAAAVEHAFRGHNAGGGTLYSSGVRPLAWTRPTEEEDGLFIFVGDEAGENGAELARTIRGGGFSVVALALLVVVAPGWDRGTTVRAAAESLGVPYFEIDERMFDDPYAVTRTLRDLIASAPGATSRRRGLVDEILGQELLEKPLWA